MKNVKVDEFDNDNESMNNRSRYFSLFASSDRDYLLSPTAAQVSLSLSLTHTL